jgi:23S rRNA (cytidine1920-2'-O)/16S rRNA (cytidine1409-2'-O)-methyltransferase
MVGYQGLMSRKTRLLELLLGQGHVSDPKVASGLIMAGRVVCGGTVVTKPGQLVPADTLVHIRGVQLKYASRGGYKLERALRHFAVDPREKLALDAGASAGGFTDCLLKAGASRVYAVDVGYGQLRASLATDPRVHVMEKTNIGALSIASFPEPIDLAVIDVSYLSLQKAIPIVGACFVKPVCMVCLIKPLFEGLQRERMNEHDDVIETLSRFFRALGGTTYRARDVVVSPILGGNSAVEFLLLVDQLPEPAPDPDCLVATAVRTWKDTPPVPPERVEELVDEG